MELTVKYLGFPDGGTMPQIFERARELGLALWPVELGLYMRLDYLSQQEEITGNPLQQVEAPLGSLTIASEIVSEDDEFPKGFYIRKIDGVLLIRDYLEDYLHVWNPDNHFIFDKIQS